MDKPKVIMIDGKPVLQYTETDANGNTYTVNRHIPSEKRDKIYMRSKPTRNYTKKQEDSMSSCQRCYDKGCRLCVDNYQTPFKLNGLYKQADGNLIKVIQVGHEYVIGQVVDAKCGSELGHAHTYYLCGRCANGWTCGDLIQRKTT